ncbi:MAG: hypothetical protein E6J36_02205 [Chloroflexi bacterium]|nr:MAG: hypothetical protein E6J36_02205 [Chloroflexota bacterium]
MKRSKQVACSVSHTDKNQLWNSRSTICKVRLACSSPTSSIQCPRDPDPLRVRSRGANPQGMSGTANLHPELVDDRAVRFALAETVATARRPRVPV